MEDDPADQSDNESVVEVVEEAKDLDPVEVSSTCYYCTLWLLDVNRILLCASVSFLNFVQSLIFTNTILMTYCESNLSPVI